MLFWETGSRVNTFMNTTTLTSSRQDLIAIYQPYLYYIHTIAPPFLFIFHSFIFTILTTYRIECI